MRSDKVVLPESMCAEMPMLRMKSMFATSVSALLRKSSLEQAPGEREFPGAPEQEEPRSLPWKQVERQAAAAPHVQRAVHLCRRTHLMPQARARCAADRAANRVPTLLRNDEGRGAAAQRNPSRRHAEIGLPMVGGEQAGPRPAIRPEDPSRLDRRGG